MKTLVGELQEHEWYSHTYIGDMANLIIPMSERKSRLFLCARARLSPKTMKDPAAPYALEAAERFADTGNSRRKMDKARKQLLHQHTEFALERSGEINVACCLTRSSMAQCRYLFNQERMYSKWCHLFRSIFNPFPRFNIPRTEDIVNIARNAYAKASPFIDPFAMKMLSDAIEEAKGPKHAIMFCRSLQPCHINYGMGWHKMKSETIDWNCEICQGKEWVSTNAPFVKGNWVIDEILGFDIIEAANVIRTLVQEIKED